MLWMYLAITLIGIVGVLIFKTPRVMSTITAVASIAMLGVSAYMFKIPSDSPYFSINTLSALSAFVTSTVFVLSSIYLIGYLRALTETKIISKYNLELFNIAFMALHLVVLLALFSDNIALFWIFIELSSLFSALLIVLINAKENITAGLKYIFITSSAMLFSFIGIIILYSLTITSGQLGTLNWTKIIQIASDMDPKIFLISYTFMFIGFAAKAGIVPFHSWMPHTYSKAPSAISTVLSACVSYLGIYGILKITAIAHRTEVFGIISKILIAFGTLTLVVASFTLLSKRNLKKVIGFSSIEVYGFVLIAAAFWSQANIYWALTFIFAASIAKVVLFLSAGIIHMQYNSIHLPDIRNTFKLQKLSSLGLIVGSAASIGTPLLPIFLPKVLILTEIAKTSILLVTAILACFMIAACAFAIYFITLFSQNGQNKILHYKAPISMKISLIISIILLIAFGISQFWEVNQIIMSAAKVIA